MSDSSKGPSVSGHLRISLTLSGAIALGAYEGGVLAALITAVQAVAAGAGDEPPLAVDSIGGASAGSITAVVAARTLLGGLDPVATMRQAWVEAANLWPMLLGGLESPLNIQANDRMATKILETPDRPQCIQEVGIWVSLALANLRGLGYEIQALSHDGRRRTGGVAHHKVDAVSYLDWRDYYFEPGKGAAQFLTPDKKSAMDFALASGANELGFQPSWLAREASSYRASGVSNFPDDTGGFWYTDGGTLDNEPLGRTMGLAARLDDDMPVGGHGRRRLHLLVHPHPDAPVQSSKPDWAAIGNRPRFFAVLLRALTLVRYQSLYQDILRAEKRNSQILWTQSLVREMATSIRDSGTEDAWRRLLTGSIDAVERDQAALGKHWDFGEKPFDYGNRPPRRVAPESSEDIEELLWRAIRKATGLESKNLAGVEAISPLLNLRAGDARGQGTDRVNRLLAGELLGSFGGFLDEQLRQSDFLLGYQSMLIWLEGGGLQRYGLSEDDSAKALKAVIEAKVRVVKETEEVLGTGRTNVGTRSLLGELIRPWIWPSMLILVVRFVAVAVYGLVLRLLRRGNQS